MEEFRDHINDDFAIPESIVGFFKKRGDDLEIVASTNEGGWDWRLISFSDDSKGKNPLNPFK